MSSLVGSTTRRRWTLGIPLPGSWKGWLLLGLAGPALVLLTLGLAQIFQVDGSTSSERADMPEIEWRDLLDVLNRYALVPGEGSEAVDVSILLASPQYFGAMRRQAPESAIAEPSLVFYVSENTHIDDLPAEPPQPVLRVGSVVATPVETVLMADSYHHRTIMLRYSADDFGAFTLTDGTVLEMVIPGPDGAELSSTVVSWELPLNYSAEYSSSEVVLGKPSFGIPVPAVSGIAILAVLGGLLAAMWPCLFQLTAYFIPAMAGMSMQEASTAQGLRPRVGVVRTALFFVIGFTIVYTLAGAVIGFGSQQLTNMGSFYIWQRYISIGAGIVLMGIAVRVAVRARAPLVCKMPLVSRMANKDGTSSPWESMLIGITFATGCMTCFGSAILIGMVLYVGLAGSPLVGATILFLFSLGMGIPLVFGAMAMARILPLLFRMEKVIPWMGLASSILIAGYAVLLITGNFMGASGLVYRLLGIGTTL